MRSTFRKEGNDTCMVMSKRRAQIWQGPGDREDRSFAVVSTAYLQCAVCLIELINLAVIYIVF